MIDFGALLLEITLADLVLVDLAVPILISFEHKLTTPVDNSESLISLTRVLACSIRFCKSLDSISHMAMQTSMPRRFWLPHNTISSSKTPQNYATTVEIPLAK